MILFLFYSTQPWLTCVFLFIAMLLINRLGFMVKKQVAKKTEENLSEFGPMEGALLGLLALLLSFTFGAANNKYQARRAAVITEANNLRSTIFAAELFHDSTRLQLNKHFRGYVQSRIDYARHGLNEDSVQYQLKKGYLYSDSLWSVSSEISKQHPSNSIYSRFTTLVMTLKSDITNREDLRLSPIPESIMWMLCILACASCFVIGYATHSKHNNLAMVLLFALMFGLSIYQIFDLDQPRQGLINMSDAQHQINILMKLIPKP